MNFSIHSPPPLQRLVDFLIRWRIVILLAGIAVSALAVFPAGRLEFDQSIESLYSRDNPHLRDYRESKSLFGGDEFAIVAYTDPQLLTPAGQRRLRKFSDEFMEIPGVLPNSVLNVASALSAANFPGLSTRKQEIIELFRGILLGDDNQTTAIVMRLAGEQNGRYAHPRAETIARIRKLADAHDPPAYVVGEPIQVHDMFRYVEQDGEILGLASSGLLVLVILVLFRSLRWVVLPLVVVHVTLLWTKALLVLAELQLSMVSSMLTSLVTIIGVATVIHVAVRFRELRSRLGRIDALRDTLVGLAPAIFWTCATTAGGFAVQLSSHIHPVQSFGVMMALGSMLVLLAAMVVLPAGILLGHSEAAVLAAPPPSNLSRPLHLVTLWVEHHPWRLAAICLAIVLVACGGFFRLRVETDFSRNFRETSSIVQSLDFVETRLGGAGTWEINFPAPKRLTPEFLERIRKLATRLRKLESAAGNSLTKVVAVTDGVELIPRIQYFVPDLDTQLKLLSLFQPEFVPSLYNSQAGRMRMLLRARERQSSESKLKLIDEVRRLADAEFPGAKPTGLFVLLTFLIESLLGDQWVSFVLAAASITAMMTVAYRSLRIGLISLVPNVLPIVIVIGTMGWAGWPINIATAMIASVSMGLTIDSSIHFLSGFQRARAGGADFYAALRETHQGVGRALIYANLALITGFLVLTLSNFVPLIYFGILVSVAMLGGLTGNLVLLPLLMRLVKVR